jgi:PhzF family phenazine biosynthesis protein
MNTPFVQVDAFTSEPFHGNSAAIVFLDGEPRPDDRWMQAMAAEMNLSETAYLVARPDATWDLRWFTPTVEVDLCGHATLAAAHAIWSEGRATRDRQLQFHTRSGTLLAASTRDGRVELDFPTLVAAVEAAPAAVLTALGLGPVDHSAKHPNQYRLLVAGSEAEVRGLDPDFAALRRRNESYIVTAPAVDPRFDFVSRYFAPAHGIDEDPVTGSAHCLLAPYWCERLGKSVVTGHQVSSRTGVVECELRGDRVLLRGDAVVVARGTLCA